MASDLRRLRAANAASPSCSWISPATDRPSHARPARVRCARAAAARAQVRRWPLRTTPCRPVPRPARDREACAVVQRFAMAALRRDPGARQPRLHVPGARRSASTSRARAASKRCWLCAMVARNTSTTRRRRRCRAVLRHSRAGGDRRSRGRLDEPARRDDARGRVRCARISQPRDLRLDLARHQHRPRRWSRAPVTRPGPCLRRALPLAANPATPSASARAANGRERGTHAGPQIAAGSSTSETGGRNASTWRASAVSEVP